MITKEDLNLIKNYPVLEREIQTQLNHLRERADIHSVRLDRIIVQGGKQHDFMAEYASKMDELERKYMDTLLRYKERYLELMDKIAALPSSEMQVIILRYQKGYTWRKIARIIHYSETWVQALHKEALIHMGI